MVELSLSVSLLCKVYLNLVMVLIFLLIKEVYGLLKCVFYVGWFKV